MHAPFAATATLRTAHINQDKLGDAAASVAALLTAAQRSSSSATSWCSAPPQASGELEGEEFAGGYLANVSPSTFAELYEPHLPDSLTGGQQPLHGIFREWIESACGVGRPHHVMSHRHCTACRRRVPGTAWPPPGQGHCNCIRGELRRPNADGTPSPGGAPAGSRLLPSLAQSTASAARKCALILHSKRCCCCCCC